MSRIDEDEAAATLAVLNELGEVQAELAAMTGHGVAGTAAGTPAGRADDESSTRISRPLSVPARQEAGPAAMDAPCWSRSGKRRATIAR